MNTFRLECIVEFPNRNQVEPMMLLTMRLHWFGTLGVR